MQLVLNPKCGLAYMVPLTIELWPNSAHAFAYRACDRVVNSFGAVMNYPPSDSATHWSVDTPMPPGPPECAAAMKTLSTFTAARLSGEWLNCVKMWAEAGVASEPTSNDPLKGAKP